MAFFAQFASCVGNLLVRVIKADIYKAKYFKTNSCILVQ